MTTLNDNALPGSWGTAEETTHEVSLEELAREAQELAQRAAIAQNRLKVAQDKAHKEKVRKIAETIEISGVTIYEVAECLGIKFPVTDSAESDKPTTGKRDSTPKYFNPENPSETYSGSGKHPAWVKNYVTLVAVEGKTTRTGAQKFTRVYSDEINIDVQTKFGNYPPKRAVVR